MVTCVFFSTFLIFLHFSLLYFVFIYSFPLFISVAFLVVKTSAFPSQITTQLNKKAQGYELVCIIRYPYCLYIVVRYGRRERGDILNSSRRQKYKTTFSISDFKSLQRLFVLALISHSLRKIDRMNDKKGRRTHLFDCFTSKRYESIFV